MKVFLLLNSSKNFGHSEGRLNNTLHETAKQFLIQNKCVVMETLIDKGYNIEHEVQKILCSDVIIHQMPAWWMSYPWILKKWIDEVFTNGRGKLYENDGRTSKNPKLNYGKGGLLQGKQYMFSMTWNAPQDAFLQETDFFEGKGIDGVLLHLHKAHQFIGMSALPTFMCNDVMKVPNVEKNIVDYKEHLKKILSSLNSHNIAQVECCQSCGLPFDDNHSNFIDSKTDGSKSIYCTFCCKEGKFVQPNATVEDMMDIGVFHLSKKIGESSAKQYMSSLIPNLKRWNK
ncbi:MAG: NAD(P)H-dependent oxidoreductase [Clostridiales bacterium]|nr:NAD(P)H-dependent oxidoreductase [Clostridiales bacterium]